MSRPLTILCVLMLAMMVACGERKPDPDKLSEKLKNATVVDAKDLLQRYKDVAAGDTAFKNKWLVVAGEVASADKEKRLLTLKVVGTSTVECRFGAEWESQLEAEAGKPTKICGRCIGSKQDSVILVECFFPVAIRGLAEAKASSRSMKIEAWTMAQSFVEKRLKSPSTASFGGISNYQDPLTCVESLGDSKYRVRGWVDAQNAFGATVRIDFSLTLKREGETWRLIEEPDMVQR